MNVCESMKKVIESFPHIKKGECYEDSYIMEVEIILNDYGLSVCSQTSHKSDNETKTIEGSAEIIYDAFGKFGEELLYDWFYDISKQKVIKDE